jgi:hypothetical protein
MGVHGMIVVGGARLFFSHIPMFSAPHDAQVLLEGEMSDIPDRPATFAAELFTFEPRPFSLDALIDGELRAFEGDLYRGSFENGGTKVATDVQVRVKKLLVARILGAGSAAHDVLFGTPDLPFALHAIDTPADVDEVARLRPTTTVSAEALAAGVALPRLATHRFGAGSAVGPLTVDRDLSCLVGPDYDRPCD